MTVHRVIFRIDYTYNYAMVDAQGEIMRMVMGLGENFWGSGLSESQAERTISAKFVDESKKTARHVSVSPGHFVFGVESAKGWTIAALETDQSIGKLFGLAAEFCAKFHIEHFERAGFRLFTFGSKFGGFDKSLARFEAGIDSAIKNAVKTSVGNFTDICLVFDGRYDEKAAYSLRMGPYSSNEARKYFEQIQLVDEFGYDYICDFDYFEKSFSLKSVRPAKWAMPAAARAEKLVAELKSRFMVEPVS